MDKGKREQVQRACQRCANSKRKCSGTFPCERCVRLGAQETCVQVKTKRELDPVSDEAEKSGGDRSGRAPVATVSSTSRSPPFRQPIYPQSRRREDGNDMHGGAPTILGAPVFDTYADPSRSGGGSGRKRRAQRLSRDVVAAHEDYSDASGTAGGPAGGYREYYAYPHQAPMYEAYVPGSSPATGGGMMAMPRGMPMHPGMPNPHGRISVGSGGDTSWDGTGDEGYDEAPGVAAVNGFEADISEAESEISHTGASILFARAQIAPPHGANFMYPAAPPPGVRHSKMRRVERQQDQMEQAGPSGGEFGAMNAVDLLLRASGEAADQPPAYTDDLRQHANAYNTAAAVSNNGRAPRGRKAAPEPSFEVVHSVSFEEANSAVADSEDLDMFGAVPVWRLTFADAATGTPEAPPEGSYARIGAKPLGEGIPYRIEANALGCVMFNVAEEMLFILPLRENVWLHPMDYKDRQTIASTVREKHGTYYTVKGRYLRTIVSLVEEDDTDPYGSEGSQRASFSAFHVLAGGTQPRKGTGSFSVEQPPSSQSSAVPRKKTRQETSYEVFTAQEHVYVSYWPSGGVKSLLCAFESVQLHGRITKEEYEVMKMSAQAMASPPESPQSPSGILSPGVLAALRTLPPPDQMQAALAALHAGDEATYRAILNLINNPQLPRTTAYSRGESFSDVPMAARPGPEEHAAYAEGSGGHPPRRGSNASYSSGGFSYAYVDTDPSLHPQGHQPPGVHAWQNTWASSLAAAQAVAVANGVPVTLVGPGAAVSMIRSASEQQLMGRGPPMPQQAFPLATPQAPSTAVPMGYGHGHAGSFNGRFSGDFSHSGVFDVTAIPSDPTPTVVVPDPKAEGRAASNTSMGLAFNEYPITHLPNMLTPGLASHESERTESSSSMGLRFGGAVAFGLPGTKDGSNAAFDAGSPY